ncbi:MAG: protein kinase domain-containing protein [Candidatus Nitrospinota bacterium M3_3B_026]
MDIKRLGRFEVLEEIGSGGMGIVYKGRDPKINRLVALKVIRPQVGSRKSDEQKQAAERFYVEARAAGQLSHKNIVTIYDVGEETAPEGDLVYIAMEFLDGEGLDHHIASNTYPSLYEKLGIVRQIAEGLDYAHRRGVIHRDVKPANIIITEGDTPKLTDFGLARLSDSSLTLAGTILGTPNYMAPEQVQGKKVDARSDFFSLTVILYELLTSQKPFAADSITSVIYRVVNDDHTPPRKLNGALPKYADELINKGLSKDPARRFQGGAEFIAAIDRLAEEVKKSPVRTGQTTIETPRARVEDSGTVAVPRPGAWPKKFHGKAASAAVAALALVLGVAYYLSTDQAPPPPPIKTAVKAPPPEADAAAPAGMKEKDEAEKAGEPSAEPGPGQEEAPPLSAGQEAKAEPAPKTAPASPEPETPEPVTVKKAPPVMEKPPREEPEPRPAPAQVKKEPAPKPVKPAPKKQEPPRFSYMDIESEPAGADVFIGGKYMGHTPINNIRLRQGEVALLLKKEGYTAAVKKVTLGGAKKQVKVSLLESEEGKGTAPVLPEKARASLEIVVPPGSVIFIDGREYRKQKLVLDELSAGSHIVHVQVKGRAPHSERVVLEAGEKRRMDLR